jgi:hypothetical protein
MTSNRAGPDFDPDGTFDDDTDPTFDDTDELDDTDREQAEELASEIAAVRARLARVPAATVVANHTMGLYELAAIHLSQDVPNFSEATLAIDAMAALIDRLQGRLGADEATLRESLAQLRLAFVTLKDRSASSSSDTDD